MQTPRPLLLSPAQIRDELLSQHACLRGRLEALHAVAQRWAQGLASQADVRNELAGLLDALRIHNIVEERTLRQLVSTADAWGPVRVEVMDASHVGEHRDVFDAIRAVGLAPDARDALRELERLATNLAGRMSEEEAAFLNETVLRDDLVAIDVQDG
jgi:hypothetical protein